MTPKQQFILALIKEIGDLLRGNAALFLGLLSAFGIGLHVKQPTYMRKDDKTSDNKQ